EVPPRPRNVRELQRALERLYPPELRDLGVTAEVEVRFRVDEAGNVQSPSISRSNDPRFNSATLAAVQVLRFIPARVGGKPVKAWVCIPIRWTIGSIPLSEAWRYPVRGQAPR
ncbi:MAG: energy transducer TonB, partial [Gemmatimonadetes bacterium]|nr:energy transducer TonB [Gemmatimonadota bacterium]